MDEQVQEAPEARVSFFTLNPRKIGRSRLLRALLIGLVIVTISCVPVWRLGWYYPLYSMRAFFPVLDTRWHPRAAWHWIDGREIRIYGAPEVGSGEVEEIRQGVQALVDDLKLDFTVRVLPMPPAVLKAYRQSLLPRKDISLAAADISFARLESRLIELRAGDPHADMLVVNAPLKECGWAHGMATFTSGVAVLEASNACFHLGKHETGHLLGYLYHDNLPFCVIGYPWEGSLMTRDTLMMLYSPSCELSPRARDALTCFWQGLEHRSGKPFFRK